MNWGDKDEDKCSLRAHQVHCGWIRSLLPGYISTVGVAPIGWYSCSNRHVTCSNSLLWAPSSCSLSQINASSKFTKVTRHYAASSCYITGYRDRPVATLSRLLSPTLCPSCPSFPGPIPPILYVLQKGHLSQGKQIFPEKGHRIFERGHTSLGESEILFQRGHSAKEEEGPDWLVSSPL